MVLTVATVGDYLQRRLDGECSVPLLTLTNQAGEHLVSMHGWSWLARPPAKLHLVAGSTKIALPIDFGRALGPPRSRGSACFEWTTPDRLASLQASQVGYAFCGAVMWTQDPTCGGLIPHIELSGPVTTSQSDAFRLAYLAGWTELKNDNTPIPLPAFMEPLLLEIVFAFAQGYDEWEEGDRAQRLAALMQSPAFLAAARRDGSAQPSLGMMRGGAVQELAARNDGIQFGSSALCADPT